MEIKSHDREADGKLHYTENFPLVQPQRCSSHGEVADAPKKVQGIVYIKGAICQDFHCPLVGF